MNRLLVRLIREQASLGGRKSKLTQDVNRNVGELSEPGIR